MVERLSHAKLWLQTTVAVLSFGISLLVFLFLLGSLPLALIIMISVAIHELCHLVAARLYGVKSGIIFLTFLALTYYTNIDQKTFKWDKMSKAIWITSAGLIGSCTLGLILLGLEGTISSWFIDPAKQYLLWAAWLNLFLTLLNLAPITIFGTDGWKITTIIMRCYSEKREEAAVLFLTLAKLAGIVGTWILVDLGQISLFIGWLVMLFFGFDLGTNIRLCRQQLPPTPEGLTKDEAMKHTLIYFGLVILTLFGLWLLPVSKLIAIL